MSREQPSRRRILREGAAGAAALGLAAGLGRADVDAGAGPTGKRITNGRIKQSLVHWCFAPHWDVEAMIRVARQLGCGSIELIDPKHFPLLKRHGLECAIGSVNMSPGPSF